MWNGVESTRFWLRASEASVIFPSLWVSNHCGDENRKFGGGERARARVPCTAGCRSEIASCPHSAPPAYKHTVRKHQYTQSPRPMIKISLCTCFDTWHELNSGHCLKLYCILQCAILLYIIRELSTYNVYAAYIVIILLAFFIYDLTFFLPLISHNIDSNIIASFGDIIYWPVLLLLWTHRHFLLSHIN